jgi:hypothetical protein
MNKPSKRSLLVIGLSLIWLLVWNGRLAQAQWPPFTLRLTPSYEGGRVTYTITQLRSEVDWLISDIRVQIPLPPGLRFVEAVADPPVQAGFDGQEVFFFFLSLDPPVKNAYFVVEVTDPGQPLVTIQPWLSWEGKFPGSYSPEPITVDTSQPVQHLDWQGPVRPALQLQLSATTTGETLTYKIYPQKMRRGRVWDLKINLPLPEGLTFLSAEAPPAFEVNVDPQEGRFFTLELPFTEAPVAGSTLEEEIEALEPLTVNLSTVGVITPTLTTRAWASWKNATRQAGVTLEAEGQAVTGDIVVQPQVAHYTVTDGLGDAPFAEYDLTGVSLQNSETMLQVGFYTAGPLCGTSQPLEFRLFLDADCQAETGQPRNGLGAEYEIFYDLSEDRGIIRASGNKGEGWSRVEATLERFVGRQAVLLQAPYSALGNNHQFCWVAQSRNRNETFAPPLPADWLPNSADMRLVHYQPQTSTLASLTSLTGTETAAATPSVGSTTVAPWAACPVEAGESASATPLVVTEPAGRIAVPLYNSDTGEYAIHLFSMPEAREVAYIINARQPHLRADGQRLLFRRPEDNGGIYEYNFMDRTGELVSERLNHQHPFYDPWGNRLVYGNQDLILGADGKPHSFLLVQCSLLPPHVETEQRCQDILGFGVLLPAGQMGEIQGSHPVWTATDLIAYSGCNSWAGFNHCGIYTVPSLSTKGFSNGFIPGQLTDHPTDTPADTKGDFIAFSSQREDNWEAYLIHLDGSGLTNLSNSSDSQDGLPAISPDGAWVAFVSNRGGAWAVWATSIDGRQTRKLFELPAGQQVGKDEVDWLNERLAWGP